MREQLKKEIVRRTGGYVQSAEAAAAYEEESAKIAAAYDSMVAQGMTELEAYRALLQDIEAMKLLLASMPPSETIRAGQEKAEKRKNKKLRKLVGGMQAVLWLLTPIWYFLSSFITGNWHLTWLIFLGSAAGSILLDMIVKVNEGKPLGKCGGWHGIFWLALVMFYFWFSFHFGGWALTWLLFPAGAMAEVLWKTLSK